MAATLGEKTTEISRINFVGQACEHVQVFMILSMCEHRNGYTNRFKQGQQVRCGKNKHSTTMYRYIHIHV